MTNRNYLMLIDALEDGAPMSQALAVAQLNIKDLITMRANVQRDTRIQRALDTGKENILRRKKELYK